MRLSTAEIQNASIRSMLDQQSQLNHTQEQLSSGRSIVTPADNPPGSAQALDLQSAIETNKQYMQNGNAATARLNLEQSTLSQAQDLVQRVRTLTIEANNGTQTNESRSSIAAELSQSLLQLIAIGNTRDGNGNYIFAGSRITTQPFSQEANGSFKYSGDLARRYLQIDSSRQISINDPGADVFMQIPNGNGAFTAVADKANAGSGVIDPGSVINKSAFTGDTYQIKFINPTTYDVLDTTKGTTLLSKQTFDTGASITFGGIQTSISGKPAAGDSFTIAPSTQQSVFQTLRNIVTVLNTPVSNTASRTRLHNALNQQLISLDQALGSFINMQASVGSRLSAIGSQQNLQQDWGVQLAGAKSKIEDLNYPKAISQYQLQLDGLEAARKTYRQVQGLSLFKYI